MKKWNRFLVRNYKKTLMLVSIMVMGIFLMSLTNMVINSINVNVYKAWAKPFSEFYVVEPIKSEVKIKDNDNCYGIFLDKIFITGVTGRISTFAFFVNEDARDFIVESNEVSMIEGRFPDVGTNEIVISREIADNKGIGIGDFIGKEIEADEGVNGKYEIVGIFEGEGVFSIGDYNYYKLNNVTASECVLTDNNNVIYQDEEVGVNVNVYSYETEELDIKEYGQILTVCMIVLTVFIYIVVIFIVIFVMYIYYSQRKSEYGILLAIGYKKRNIVSMAIKEVVVVSVSAFCIGSVASLLVGMILNVLYFENIGQSIYIWELSYFYASAVMCILIVFFAAMMIWRMISKIDCIALIEGD